MIQSSLELRLEYNRPCSSELSNCQIFRSLKQKQWHRGNSVHLKARLSGKRERSPLVYIQIFFNSSQQHRIFIFLFAENEVQILKNKVERFESLEKMFLELLKMCEQFETRVTSLENQLKQKDQEASIEEAVARRISLLKMEKDKSNSSHPSKSEVSSAGAEVKSTPSSGHLSNTNVPKEVSTMKTEDTKLDKFISSRLSPTAPEFVLPKRSNPSESIGPRFANQFCNGQNLMLPQLEFGRDPNMNNLGFDHGSNNPVPVLPHGLPRYPIPGAHVPGYQGALMPRYPDAQVVRCLGVAQPLFLNPRLI